MNPDANSGVMIQFAQILFNSLMVQSILSLFLLGIGKYE